MPTKRKTGKGASVSPKSSKSYRRKPPKPSGPAGRKYGGSKVVRHNKSGFLRGVGK